MDVPSLRKYIHTRWIYAKNCQKHSEYKVPKNIGTALASKAKAYANTYDGRSFAEVLKKGIPKIAKEKRTQPVAKIQQKVLKPPRPTCVHCVSKNHPTSSNSYPQHGHTVVSNTQNSDFVLNPSNRFQILASNDTSDNVSEASDKSPSHSLSMTKKLAASAQR